MLEYLGGALGLTEEQAKQVIRQQGWTPHIKPIARGRYLYAAKKQAGKVVDKYICPIVRLDRMTEETIVAKLRISAHPLEG